MKWLVLILALSACTNHPDTNLFSGQKDRGLWSADKAQHAAAGIVTAAGTEAALGILDVDPVAFDINGVEVRWSCITSILIGIGKEWWDVTHGSGYYEVADAVYTGGAGCVVTWNF